MRSDIVPGATFPGYELPDHEDVPRRLSELQGDDPLTGGRALGPEAGEWLQQATLAVRAGVPLEVPRDTIQPFPTFSEIYVAALKALRGEIRRSHEYSNEHVSHAT